MADRVGQQFGHYQLTKLLGKGGFAEAYLGKHIHQWLCACSVKLERDRERNSYAN